MLSVSLCIPLTKLAPSRLSHFPSSQTLTETIDNLKPGVKAKPGRKAVEKDAEDAKRAVLLTLYKYANDNLKKITKELRDAEKTLASLVKAGAPEDVRLAQANKVKALAGEASAAGLRVAAALQAYTSALATRHARAQDRVAALIAEVNAGKVKVIERELAALKSASPKLRGPKTTACESRRDCRPVSCDLLLRRCLANAPNSDREKRSHF